MPTLNDIHSRLNPTKVAEFHEPTTLDELSALLTRARKQNLRISTAGGRHAMGAQQFATNSLHIDTRKLSAVLDFDPTKGLITIQAGATWPAVIDAIRARSGPSTPGSHTPPDGWAIRQKQTGADDLTLGGAVSANVHGRVFGCGPFVEDVESLTLLHPDGSNRTCSRETNTDLFSLVCGGYGMFGIIADVTLRLVPRQRLVRLVDICDIDDALNAVHRRFAEGCIYGDFQYSIDADDDDEFLRRGVFACYKPARPGAPDPEPSADLSREDWIQLLRLAHDNPRKAFGLYAGHYLSTHGRTYWSDTMQLATYLPGYAEFLHDRGDASSQGITRTLMITELYVPPAQLPAFMAQSRQVLRQSGVRDIYGTIRSIRQDSTTFLPWATGQRACIIFNLLVEHTPQGVERATRAARGLIDAAADLEGSFYLTYHRWATRDQLLRCYPQLPQWLELKRTHDPHTTLTSDWFEHLRAIL